MSLIDKLKNNKTVKQTIFLFSSQIVGLVIGFLANMFLAKQMGPQKFGIYSFSLSIISFLSIFFEFGYFASSSRILAQLTDKKKEREIIGASFVIALTIALLFVLTVFVVSLFVDHVFKDKVGNILRIASIVSWSFIIPFYVELILKGTNHIEILSVFQLVWKLLFVIFLILLFKLNHLEPLYVLYLLSVSCIISFTYVIFKLSPSFKKLYENIKEIFRENKVYGIHIYLGRVIDVSTYQLDRLMIGYFANAKEVGFYSLANSMANPINTFSASLASSKFKDFASHKPISKRILMVNFLWIAMAIIGTNVLGYTIIRYYLGDEYRSVLVLLLLMTLAVGFQAAYQPYNAWLSSNGYGKEMRKLNFKMAFASVALNLAFIPTLHAIGAAIASILSMLYTFILYMRLYSVIKG